MLYYNDAKTKFWLSLPIYSRERIEVSVVMTVCHFVWIIELISDFVDRVPQMGGGGLLQGGGVIRIYTRHYGFSPVKSVDLWKLDCSLWKMESIGPIKFCMLEYLA